jgi:NAD(P)H-dependent FMN reductase
VLASAGARVLEGELPVPVAHTQFDETGRLVDEEAHQRLAEVVQDLVAAAAARATVAA